MAVAILLLNAEVGQEDNVLEYLKNKPRISGTIKEAYVVYGTYDVIARLEADNMDKLKDSVTKIRRYESVRSSVTLIAYET